MKKYNWRTLHSQMHVKLTTHEESSLHTYCEPSRETENTRTRASDAFL